MKWLQDNPLGMALAGISAVFVVLAALMAVLWTLPVSVDKTTAVTEESSGNDVVLMAHPADELNEFLVINQKPVFNESRLPVIEVVGDEELAEDTTVSVKNAPDVRLTGVIITPSVRIASLTPADGNLENVMAHEGQPLTGDFAGWLVSSVSPRSVMLESRDGQQLELELQVHDVAIKEPPKPVVKAEPEPEGQKQGEDGEPLSRAEQIRQRIAERREELRKEQEEQQAQQQAGSGGSKPSSYQTAIRSMMNKKPKDTTSDDNKDG
jgi:hypothetical protein